MPGFTVAGSVFGAVNSMGFDGLAYIVLWQLGKDAMSGERLLFTNRCRQVRVGLDPENVLPIGLASQLVPHELLAAHRVVPPAT